MKLRKILIIKKVIKVEMINLKKKNLGLNLIFKDVEIRDSKKKMKKNKMIFLKESKLTKIELFLKFFNLIPF